MLIKRKIYLVQENFGLLMTFIIYLNVLSDDLYQKIA